MRLGFALSAMFALTVAGCGLAREPLANNPQDFEFTDNTTCTGMGLKLGSTEFAQCRLALMQRRDNAAGIAQANDAAARANAASALQGMANNIQTAPPSAYYVPPMQPIGGNTITVRRGGF